MYDHIVKAIIFDLGNVLIDVDYHIAAKRISKFTETKTPAEIFGLFFDSWLTGIFEEGKISPQDFFLKVKEILNLKLDYDKFLPIWNEIFFLNEKNIAVYNLAKSFKSHYRLALLSNINILHFEYIKQKFPHLLDAFHIIITSYESGFRKPDPMIYKRAVDSLGFLPQEVFYTDDRAELVESARELGIRAVVFRDIEELKQELLNSGININ
jgi:putative hydrolase of the HAD superfamily